MSEVETLRYSCQNQPNGFDLFDYWISIDFEMKLLLEVVFSFAPECTRELLSCTYK